MSVLEVSAEILGECGLDVGERRQARDVGGEPERQSDGVSSSASSIGRSMEDTIKAECGTDRDRPFVGAQTAAFAESAVRTNGTSQVAKMKLAIVIVFFRHLPVPVALLVTV